MPATVVPSASLTPSAPSTPGAADATSRRARPADASQGGTYDGTVPGFGSYTVTFVPLLGCDFRGSFLDCERQTFVGNNANQSGLVGVQLQSSTGECAFGPALGALLNCTYGTVVEGDVMQRAGDNSPWEIMAAFPLTPEDFNLSFTTKTPVVSEGHRAIMTARTTSDLSGLLGVPSFEVFDASNSTGVNTGSCTAEDFCQVYSYVPSGAPHKYYAEMVDPQIGQVLATSTDLTISRAPWTVSLSYNADSDTLIAVANQAPSSGGYELQIFNKLTGGAAATCATLSTCTYTVPGSESAYVAVVSPGAGSYQALADVQATSTTVLAPVAANGNCQCSSPDPVNTFTGVLSEPATDLDDGGRGPGLKLSRLFTTDGDGTPGPFGLGWQSNVGVSLTLPVPFGEAVETPGGADPITPSDPSWIGNFPPGSEYLNPGVRGEPVRAAITGSLSPSQLNSPPADDQELAGQVAVPVSTVPFVDVTLNGIVVPFRPTGSGGFTAPSYDPDTLAENSDGSWVVTEPHGITMTFNALGWLMSETDLNGNTLTMAYDAQGRLTTVTDAVGRAITLSYGQNGYVDQATDPAGRTVSCTQDAAGHLTSVTDPTGATTSYGYDSHDRLTSVTHPNGKSVAESYDGVDRVVSQVNRVGATTSFGYGDGVTTMTEPNGSLTDLTYTDGRLTSETADAEKPGARTATFTYDPVTLNPASVTDPDGNTWRYTWDAAGDETSVTDPDGHSTTATYNNINEPLTVTDANGVTTTDTYDAAGNLLSTSTPISPGVVATSTYTYGDGSHPGDVTAATDPNGNTSRFAYDQIGDVTSATAPNGAATTYAYSCASGCENGIGWLYSTVSPRGNASGANPSQYTTSFTRDLDGRVTGVRDPLGQTTSYAYDGDGNVTSVTNPKGKTTSYGYDGLDELTSLTRPDGSTQATSYDVDGNVTAQTSAGGHTTSYMYDPFDEVTSMTTPPTASSPAGITTGYGYDPNGNVTSVTQPGAGGATLTTSYGYDPADRLTAIGYSDGVTPNVSYHYDADGRRTSMTDGTGTTSYAYNQAGWLTSLTNGAGATVGYGYDQDGNATAITYPNTKTVTRGYDTNDQLDAVTDWNGKQTTFTYDPDGDLTATRYQNGVTEADSYRPDDSMSELADTEGATTLADYAYARDPNAALTGVTATGTSPGPNDSYGYNDLDQLNQDTTTVTGAPSGSFSYDPDGDLTAMPGGTTLTYDNADELTSTTTTGGINDTYGYDARGERTAVTPSFGPAQTLSYNQADELTGYATSMVSAHYTYNGDGQRTAKTVGTTTNPFTYDPVTGQVPLLLSDGTHNFIYGPNDLPIEQIQTDGGGGTISFVGGGTATDPRGFADSLHVTFDHTAEAGDQILLAVNTSAGQTVDTPTGYTQLGHYQAANGDGATTVFLKTATGGETDATIEFGPNSEYHPKSVIAAIYRGASTTTPAQVSAGTGRFSSTVAAPLLSGNTDSDQIISIADAVDDLSSSPTWQDTDGRTTVESATTPRSASAILDGPDTTNPQASSVAKLNKPGQLELVVLALQPATTSGTQYIQHDQLGSTRLLTDPNGTVVASYAYNPYGATITKTGTASSPLQFNGQYTDTESGLYHLQARYYDPTTGSFLTRDPLEALTGQPYQYAGSDPLDATDPTGLSWYNPLSWCAGTWTKVGIGAVVIALAATGVGAAADAGILSGVAAGEGLATGAAATAGAATLAATTAGSIASVKVCAAEGFSANCFAGLALSIGGLTATLATSLVEVSRWLFWGWQFLGFGYTAAGERNYDSGQGS